MYIQSQLNNIAISKLKKVKDLLIKLKQEKKQFELDQIINHTLRNMCNSYIAIDDMTNKQLKNFENKLLETFKDYNWI